MEIKTRIGGVLMNVAFAFTSDEKRDHYAGQAAITAVASAIKIAADKASVKGMTEAEVIAASFKLKAPDGLTDIKVTVAGAYVPKTQSAEAKLAEAAKASYDRAIAAGLTPEVASAVSGWTAPAPAAEAAAEQPELPADESGDVES